MNTALWDMIQPSINFTGSYEMIDAAGSARFKVLRLVE